MRIAKSISYELIGAGLAGGGVIAGATLVEGAQALELSLVMIIAASAAAGGAFFGRHVRHRSERLAAEQTLRQCLWDTNCVLNSSPLEFVRLASAHVVNDSDQTLDRASRLALVAEVVAYALDPQVKAEHRNADPVRREQFDNVANWVIPLLNSCGIAHKYSELPDNQG